MKWVDDIYYKYPVCIPFMSTLYLPNVILSFICRKLSLDLSFRIYTWFILGHYLLGSFLAYFVFRQWAGEMAGLFGAITLTYAGYVIKPQTPSFVFTAMWLPGAFHQNGVLSTLSLALALLGGYWPILCYVFPVVVAVKAIYGQIWPILLGVLLALPQILAFMWYWPKSVRAGQKVDRNFGRIPWWKLKDFFIPSNSVNQTNGVHFPEMEMYMGIAPLLIFSWSWWWIPLILSILIGVGVIPQVQRIPSRSLYLTILSICFLATGNNLQNQVLLVFLNAFLLLKNSSIYPSFPFSQWWDKPSKVYPKADITGYLSNKRIGDYRGAFALR